ncbi:MarR family winged helix-turn-helix transcriptional regulator [Williamsia deligens]|uniref:MarR family winged helix-turn-helix transcriptional regulator n=1 Tax=Williamsia deligens TaxID=321325 RepID=A0ABW3G5C8_9NOCA|nr:MarR family winged helix-turn-helix transcriptional regulator [Williamsia deligens]
MSQREDAGSRPEHALDETQQQTWLAYMRVHHRLEYEMNRQLLCDSGLSLGDYTVLTALSQRPDDRARLGVLATTIGWERSRLSHHLKRMGRRDLVVLEVCESDRRATEVALTDVGRRELDAAAPGHAAWVRSAFFADLDTDRTRQLGGTLEIVHETLLRAGTLPHPDQT